jgi:hypothetical protein
LITEMPPPGDVARFGQDSIEIDGLFRQEDIPRDIGGQMAGGDLSDLADAHGDEIAADDHSV